MGTKATVAKAALVCLAMGVSVAGCANDTTAEKPSAGQLLDNANHTMSALRSVTIDTHTGATAMDGYYNHVTTDLKSTCASTTTWSTGGARFDQIRIGGTDYIRPNRAYLELAGKKMAGTKEQSRWIRTPADEADEKDGVTDCKWPFASFGTATKGEPTKVDGSPAIPLVVTDKADEGGSYTFYVATEGKPYILKVDYKSAARRSTTSFSAFDKPLEVRPPARADVLDGSAAGH
ncbi:hypothetical protein [Streptomyces sp. NPDC046197]|uniref:hypothetical protein n=1 Tax=Streptomyces sp. NPDC046197 TaxID=3154337 RepID=UPI0033CD80EE